ncbi:nuclear hormone receptor HR96-like [Vespa mandarinia]|uniref:nuclear hormone receptor HR96-like n=1 Tax=Vespa mandarinia TaxID=7446 RepID=UPI00161A053D|nr:nuclear hormone receptor HR96-like [Vespa mandarinia]XP_035740063.1 nuclear hormone receptor HR96-like [Vespa mandarinia]XP_035740154.1 nuclear hormone receptor HR96-like [Vespa mandarinia]XP_035740241.1 nuclear hormone receptor HR96-like [Vespa mandarinia]
MEDEQPAREANKICGVCGDRALGYNFNAVSCESCKAFFRRNALKNKDFRCPFTENCSITPVTRRFCQKCRLDKCFSIGMRKEYIMSEEDKVLKRQKIEQNRAKKRPQSDNVKASKIKKDCVEDCTFEDTAMSMNSVASTVSDTYFWESDKKYADLDAGRQNPMENMSPVTAASVPSPSSPPESGNITGSKTLDMLKDSYSNKCTFVKYELISQYDEPNADVDSTRRITSHSPIQSTRTRYNEFDLASRSAGNDKSMSISSRKFDQNLLEFDSNFGNSSNQSPRYTHEYEDSTTSYCKYEQSPESGPSTFIDSNVEATQLNLSPISHTNVQTFTEETTACQRPKEMCPKGNDLVNKFTQNPGLVMKFVNNPHLVAKIFQDRNLILKIMTDPVLVNRLAADPQISQFFKENSIDNNDADPVDQLSSQQEEDTMEEDVSVATSKHQCKSKQCHVENPILTDLITYKNTVNYKNKDAADPSMNKMTADVTKDVLQDVQRIPIAANSIESILCEAIKLEFSAYSALGGNQSTRELNDAERAKLNELIVANKALLAPLDDDITNLVGEECKFKGSFGQSDPMLLDVINLTAIAIRRLIKMSKKMNAFKNMCQEDQLALLKGGCTEMMILRSALNYDPDKDMWKIPHSQERMSNIKVDVLKEAKGNLYAEHAKFVRTFDPRWRDENIILILSAIALFTPDRPKVVHSDVIKLEQNSYYYLLRRYLESVYPGCEAKSTFLKLIQKISELHRLNDEVVNVYLNVNPSSVEPLLIEIFDLKH